MIQLPLKRLKPGMVMTQGIYNGSGGSFLSKGVSLTESYIQKLHDLGIASVTVTSMDPRDRIAPPEDVLEEKTRVLAVKRVYDIFQQVAKKRNIRCRAAHESIFRNCQGYFGAAQKPRPTHGYSYA